VFTFRSKTQTQLSLAHFSYSLESACPPRKVSAQDVFAIENKGPIAQRPLAKLVLELKLIFY